jgi:hypothetical protein
MEVKSKPEPEFHRHDAGRQQATPKGQGVDVVNLLKAELKDHYPAVWTDKRSVFQGVLCLAYSLAIQRMHKAGQKDFDREKVLETLAEDLEVRAQVGEAKYGERLTTHNGRDAELDLYQELLDAVNYSRQDLEESKSR